MRLRKELDLMREAFQRSEEIRNQQKSMINQLREKVAQLETQNQDLSVLSETIVTTGSELKRQENVSKGKGKKVGQVENKENTVR